MIDFSALKRFTREVCDELDHHFLLQRDSPLLQIEEREGAWGVRFGDREYAFPRQDVVALPIENTTAELLAEYIAERVVTQLQANGHGNISGIEVDVEEMPGQSGGYARDVE